MKSAIVLVFGLFFILFASAAQAQEAAKPELTTHWSAEVYASCSSEGCSPTVDVYLTAGKPDSKIGMFGWALVAPGWAEAYGGVTYAPLDGLELSLGAGMEQAEKPWRTTASVFAARGRFSLFAVGEYGGSGGWYHAQLMVKANDQLSIGAMSQAFAGSGLKVEGTVWHLKPWVGILADHAVLKQGNIEPRVLLGVKASF